MVDNDRLDYGGRRKPNNSLTDSPVNPRLPLKAHWPSNDF